MIRKLRDRFIDGGYPHDFEAEFRRVAHLTGPPVMLPTGSLGRQNVFTNWETVISGVSNPRADGADNLNFDGDYDSEVGSIFVSLNTSGTPRHVDSTLDNGGGAVCENEEDEESLPHLEIDEDRELRGGRGS